MKLKYVVGALALLVLVCAGVLYGGLRASLPQLDGIQLAPVSGAVTIERDSLGVPTISAVNRGDLAYGLGFAHGQDRFFQMDLSRRLAAGELSELFGDPTLDQDRKARLFRFRAVARLILQQMDAGQRRIVEAYARGVNAGLGSLGSRPWEYWVLGSKPVQWQPEDSFLVTHSMWWDLQYSDIKREIQRQRIAASLAAGGCASAANCDIRFLYPSGTDWDAPNSQQGLATSGAPPRPADTNSRRPVRTVFGGRSPAAPAGNFQAADEFARATGIGVAGGYGIGSNNWAVAGRLTATGAALVANDMHLYGRVPAIWYRARMRIPADSQHAALDLNGVTLPGAPLQVAGSNGHIAWGFTNSYGTWSSVQQVACTGVTDTAMQTHSGPVALQSVREVIYIRGKPSVTMTVQSGPAGVLFAASARSRTCWFVRWLAQLPAATNMNLIELEQAGSVSDALAVAPTLGIPQQNFVVGDRGGHIAWTIAGRVPVDTGPARATGSPVWVTEANQLRIVDPEIGRIWTANARATDDPAQQALVGGSNANVGAQYDLGARARQIRDDLLAIKANAMPADMLRIQLDDRALFLNRWHALLDGLLDRDGTANHPGRQQFKLLIVGWNARASGDSVGYRLVRAFHEQVSEAIWRVLLQQMHITAGDDIQQPPQFESALWHLVNERPASGLDPRYKDWRQFLLAQVDATVTALQASCPDLNTCTWGGRNPVRIRHPLSGALPFGAALLDMPTQELPGDNDMPRVQDGAEGASERFAVSPGHEADGYIHIAGGQSGHPLSPYYRAGFMDWVNGTPTPFLPGTAQHQLTLQPAAR